MPNGKASGWSYPCSLLWAWARPLEREFSFSGEATGARQEQSELLPAVFPAPDSGESCPSECSGQGPECNGQRSASCWERNPVSTPTHLQAKLRLEMEMERMRQTHSKEMESRDEEVEEARQSCQKKVRQWELPVQSV